ncbi:CpaF family protein [Thermicanus aegyptius]|uniref:CpaF family protein n=1 Tax=Thermicanus aegyptius TaxID=94009 RepID=UPI000421B2AC|nr:ATPase, T2SS/T4P/T4SS family [Thermicanus aegyptius]
MNPSIFTKEDFTKEEFDEELLNSARNFLTREIQEQKITLEEETQVYFRIHHFLTSRYGISTEQADRIVEEVMIDIKGYGVIAPLIQDPGVSDIIIHKHDDITYEKYGKKYIFPQSFRDQQHLMMFIEKLAFLSKARVDISHPITSFTLPEGYRTAVAIPPIALYPTVAIRKFVTLPSVDDLIQSGYFSVEAGEFFKFAIKGRRNILITGGMGTGKTSMIAIASKHFGEDEYPLLIEEVMETPMNVPHLRRLVARPPSVEGTGEITLGNLLKLALQMKPTRVIVSEVRDGAVFYMLQAMQIGHEGSMSTVHANSPKEAFFKRIPMMLSMSREAVDLSLDEKLSFAASGLHLIVHLKQDPHTGIRYCDRISEVTEEPDVKDIFVREGNTLKATGYIPERALEGALAYGVKGDEGWFRD